MSAAARTLVIDSATAACSVALFEGDVCVAGDFRMLGRGHAERLVPMIAALPGRGQAQRIAVARGPGSFTGVRVGLAAARALALAWDAQLLGYPTLELVAAMARARFGPRAFGVAMAAGHGEWFVQSFDGDGAAHDMLRSLSPEAAMSVLDVEYVAGSEAEAWRSRHGSGEALPLLPDARAFGLLRPATLTQDVRAIYGRGADAKLPGVAGSKLPA
jgi:tRNA threonylcarbamoyladenosine biosynthesis protein TsaB